MNKRQQQKKYIRDLRGLWERIGFIMHLSQMIEYNLLNILAGHKYIESIEGLSIYDFVNYNNAAKESNEALHKNNRKDLKKLLDRAIADNVFNKEMIDLLDTIKNKRNYYAHQFFKEDLFTKITETNPSYYFKKMKEDIGLFKTVNDLLVDIDKGYRLAATQ